MIGKMLCTIGRHGRDEWLPPARGTMMWQSRCSRCGRRMMRDPLSGRWRPETC
jgi:hypothetical protein